MYSTMLCYPNLWIIGSQYSYARLNVVLQAIPMDIFYTAYGLTRKEQYEMA